jgi:hypothetical protein
MTNYPFVTLTLIKQQTSSKYLAQEILFCSSDHSTRGNACFTLHCISDQLLHEDSLVEDPEKAGKMEIAFALHSQERIMGLLGAMIPAEHVPFSFHNEKFLKLLFMVAR